MGIWAQPEFGLGPRVGLVLLRPGGYPNSEECPLPEIGGRQNDHPFAALPDR